MRPTFGRDKMPSEENRQSIVQYINGTYFGSYSWVRASWSITGGLTWWLSQNLTEKRKPYMSEGEAVSNDWNNTIVDLLLTAETSFPLQGVWAQPVEHEELILLRSCLSSWNVSFEIWDSYKWCPIFYSYVFCRLRNTLNLINLLTITLDIASLNEC